LASRTIIVGIVRDKEGGKQTKSHEAWRRNSPSEITEREKLIRSRVKYVWGISKTSRCERKRVYKALLASENGNLLIGRKIKKGWTKKSPGNSWHSAYTLTEGTRSFRFFRLGGD